MRLRQNWKLLKRSANGAEAVLETLERSANETEAVLETLERSANDTEAYQQGFIQHDMCKESTPQKSQF